MRLAVSIIFISLLWLSGGTPLTAQKSFASETTPTTRVAELRKLVEKDNRSHPVASTHWSEEALQLLAAAPDSKAETWFILSLVDDLNALSEYAKANTYLERGRSLVARTRDERSRLQLEVEAGSLLSATEHPLEANLLLENILPTLTAYRARHSEDREFGLVLGRGYRILGGTLQTLGRYSEAIGEYQKAQKVYEETSDLRGQAMVLSQMGTLYSLLERHQEAENSQRQALRMAETLSDVALQAWFHLSLASTFGNQNKPDDQLASLNRALSLAGRAQDVSTQIAGMVNLADVYLKKKDYQATLRTVDAALRIPGMAKDPSNLAVCQINRGIALNRLGNSVEGLRSIQEGLRHEKNSQAKNGIAETTGILAEEYAFAGDYRRAYETHLEFKALGDQLKRDENQKHIAAASAAFESDKKQMQIEGLQREKRVQTRLTLLWIALGVLGFSVAGLLVVSRKKLQQVNHALTGLNDQNLDLIGQLQSALTEVRTLQGLIPICAYCKKIRDDQGYWSQMESYIQSRTEASFSHGICPDCAVRVRAEFDLAQSGKT